MLATAQEKLGDARSRFSFREIDVQSIPFDDASLDAVIANHMLYHVPDLSAALAEIRRVLKPDGRLFAVTNGEEHLRELRELRAAADLEEVNQGWRHIWSLPFNLSNGAELLRQHFPIIDTDLYEDALVVTKVEPLVAYLASASQEPWTAQTHQAMTDFIAAELRKQGGAIRIRKETGMFIAHG
ncbi:MAG: class I SAM-dependent methyltransferase [Caldilineaceae bacterium]|nr:class I SAM-dependent methyltransferase [Caldilineaceae bacterium]